LWYNLTPLDRRNIDASLCAAVLNWIAALFISTIKFNSSENLKNFLKKYLKLKPHLIPGCRSPPFFSPFENYNEGGMFHELF